MQREKSDENKEYNQAYGVTNDRVSTSSRADFKAVGQRKRSLLWNMVALKDYTSPILSSPHVLKRENGIW